MLAGVIGDYKEIEKLPGELAATLEGIDDAIVSAGYALVQMFVVTTLVLLILSGFRSWQVQFLITGTLSLIYLYLLRLMRDLDDPFEYEAGYIEEGSADVSPHPVLDYQARLKADLAR